MIDGLAGRWKVIGCQLNGVWLPESIFREFVYVLTGDDRYSILWSDLTYPAYQGGFPKSKTGGLRFEPGSRPGRVDLVPAEGPHQGKTFPGIFELDHDILKANFALPGNPRPSAFTAKRCEVYEVWQRID